MCSFLFLKVLLDLMIISPCNGSVHFVYANSISINSKNCKLYLPHTLA